MTEIDELEVAVPVSGGVTLHGDVYLPAGAEPAPTLLMRTPYGRRDAQRWLFAHPRWYARQGYAVVVQDVRGRWSSDGSFEPFRHERADGAETVSWVARQRWSNGRVGMYGMSYPGAVQLLAAAEQPTGLGAVAPAMTSVDFGDGWTYVGGAINLAFVLSWAPSLGIDAARRAGDLDALGQLTGLAAQPQTLYDRLDTVPLDELLPPSLWQYLPYLRDWLEHPPDDSYWRELDGSSGLDRVSVPALHVGGWYDVFLEGTLRTYKSLCDRNQAPQHLVIGPWAHAPWAQVVGDRDFGADGRNTIDEMHVAWFDHWLRERPLELAPVRAFVLNANHWVDESAWPPPRSHDVRLFLTSGGRANSASGDGRLIGRPPESSLPDVFLHDPRAPLQSAGGHSCCFENLAPLGPRDQRRSEAWNDLLVYESAPVSAPVVVAGDVRAELHVRFSGRSADFVARLVDVHPCGSAYNLVDTVVRIDRDRPARHANAEVEATGSAVFRISLVLGATYVELREGHRLRLEIGGSSYPAYARNWNGRPPSLAPTDFSGATSLHEVLHDRQHPSALLLPLLEGHLP